MEIRKIIDYINRGYIASDYLRAPDVYYYMDMVIDDINERLQAKFPTFTDWEKFCAAWNAWVGGPGQPAPTEQNDNTVPKPPAQHCVHPGPNPCIPASMYPLPCFRLPCPMFAPRFLRDNTKYDAFPDEYLRTVVALGVAVKFYTRDEEGEQIALDYQNRYEAALFKMLRDYHNQVPWYFQDNTGGFVDFTHEEEMGPWDLVPRGVVLRGKDTRIL